MIKIFLLEPFSTVIKGLAPLLKDKGIFFVDDVDNADIVVSSQLQTLLKCNVHKPKLQWTNEPRWSNNSEGLENINGNVVYVMNCFTGDIYKDIFHYLWVFKYKRINLLSSEEFEIKKNNPRKAYIVSSIHNYAPYYVNGKDINLYSIRDSLALHGYHKGIVDIYGKGWSDDIEVSFLPERFGRDWNTWENEKVSMGKKYLYNICIENSCAKNYVTEKFWHAIISQNIPIYYDVANIGLNQFFDSNTIIDAKTFPTMDELYDYILSMSKQEYITRINTLIESVNTYISNPSYLQQHREFIAEQLAQKCRFILGK